MGGPRKAIHVCLDTVPIVTVYMERLQGCPPHVRCLDGTVCSEKLEHESQMSCVPSRSFRRLWGLEEKPDAPLWLLQMLSPWPELQISFSTLTPAPHVSSSETGGMLCWGLLQKCCRSGPTNQTGIQCAVAQHQGSPTSAVPEPQKNLAI